MSFTLTSVTSVTLSAVTAESFSANAGETRTVTMRAVSAGSPVANLPVSFSVSSNGGAIAGSSTMTNSAGEASTVWTMPATSGTHRVTVNAGSQSLQFTASVTFDPTAPAKIEATFGDSVYIQPGSTKTLTAKVSNAANSGIPGVAVTFQATTAGGSVAPGLSGPFTQSVVVTTGTGGAVTVTFKAGNTEGLYTVTASAGSLTPASFRVYARNPGAPKSFDKGDGGGAAVPATSTAIISPSVRVLDEFGVPVPNVDVTWTVTSGDGLVRTISPLVEAKSVTVKTSSTGFFTSSAGFRAGPTPGDNTITASVPGVPTATFTIASTAMSVCSGITSYTLGTSVSGNLSSSDCSRYYDAGPPYLRFYMDAYRVTLTQTEVVDVTVSASYTPAIFAATETRHLGRTTGSPATVRLILPAGTFYLGAGSSAQAQTGSYTLSSTLNPDLTTGAVALTTRGINASLNVRSSSSFSNAPYNAIGSNIFLWTGEQITIEMKSSNFDAFLGVYSSGNWVATDDNSGGGTNAKIVFTAPSPGTYGIYAGTATNVVPANRAFTLTIQ